MNRVSTLWCCVLAGIACIIAIILSQTGTRPELICVQDYTNAGRTVCKPACASNSQTFGFPGMRTCHKWLDCEDIQLMSEKEIYYQGVVKKIFKARWSGHDILISEAISSDMQPDFQHHAENLKLFSPSPYVVQAVGFCARNGRVVTEFHPLGSALNAQMLPTDLKLRFRLCLSYVEILAFLHTHWSGTRVMCDSSSLAKTLSQYLLTEDMRLVLADLDALPRVEPPEGIVCGHSELSGDFVAPEQRWTHPQPFNETLVTPYDEKTDVWKISDVCDWLLGTSHQADVLRFQLFAVHRQCKDPNAESRPTSSEVLHSYRNIYDTNFQK